MEKKYVKLFPGNRDRMGHNGPYATLSGANIRALNNLDGGYELETSGLNRSDARVLSSGKLFPADKRSPNSPDFKGYLDEPDVDLGTPMRWEIAAWSKPITRGDNEGSIYLSLTMSPEKPKVPQVGKFQLREDKMFFAAEKRFTMPAGATVEIRQVDRNAKQVLLDFGDRIIDWFDDSIVLAFV